MPRDTKRKIPKPPPKTMKGIQHAEYHMTLINGTCMQEETGPTISYLCDRADEEYGWLAGRVEIRDKAGILIRSRDYIPGEGVMWTIYANPGGELVISTPNRITPSTRRIHDENAAIKAQKESLDDYGKPRGT